MAHVLAVGDRGQRLAVCAAMERRALLVGGQLRAPVEVDPAGLRAGASLVGAGTDQLALALGQVPEDGEQQAAMRRRGVGPGLLQRGAPGACARDGGERVEQVAGAAGGAVQLSCFHDDCSRAKTTAVHVPRALQGEDAADTPHSALFKKACPLGFSEPSPLT
jgi:hypothetical protein